MRSSVLISALFAICAIGAPTNPRPGNVKRDVVVDTVVEVVTITVTVTPGASRPNPTASVPQQPNRQFPHHGPHHGGHHSSKASTPAAPVQTTTGTTAVVVQTTSSKPASVELISTKTPTPSDPAPTPSTPADTPSSGSDDGSPLSGGVSQLTTVNKWRTAYGLPKLSWSKQLQDNAQKTADDNQGVTMNHQLNSGSFGQVITVGAEVAVTDLQGDTPFELSFVSWLCEVKSETLKMGGVDQCALVEKVLHMTYSSTGHYDILTATRYTKIGCGFAKNPNAESTSPNQGIWVCDLA